VSLAEVWPGAETIRRAAFSQLKNRGLVIVLKRFVVNILPVPRQRGCAPPQGAY